MISWRIAGQLCLRRLFVFGAWADRGAAFACCHAAGVAPVFRSRGLGLRGATRTGCPAAGVGDAFGQPCVSARAKLEAITLGLPEARPSRFPQVLEKPRRGRSAGESDARPDLRVLAPNRGRCMQRLGRRHKAARRTKQAAAAGPKSSPRARGSTRSPRPRTSYGGRGQPSERRRLQRRRQWR